MPGGGRSCLDIVGCQVPAWPGHGQAVGAVQTSTRWYTPATVNWGCAWTPGACRYVYTCLYAYTFVLSGLPVGHLFPGLEPRKPLLVLAFMCLGVGPTGQGGVVLFVNPGQGGVGA